MPTRKGFDRIEKPQPLEEQIYTQVKQVILDADLPANELLTETGLAEELGVSRTPIRKVLARLEQDGFIAVVPSKGYKIVPVSLQDIREIYGLREILECHILRETAPHFGNAEIAEMQASLRAADECMNQGDILGFLKHNRSYHHAFDRKFGNNQLSSVLAGLDEHVHRFLAQRLRPDKAEKKVFEQNRDHHVVLERIRQGEVEAAVTVLSRHLRNYVALISAEEDSISDSEALE